MGAGKVLGAMLGLMAGLLIGSPLAIVLLSIAGGIAGHFYDEQHALPLESPEVLADFPPPSPHASEPLDGASIEEASDAHLTRALCAVLVEVARADGDVRREEVRQVRRYFEEVLGYGAESLQLVRRHLKEFLAYPPDLEDAAGTCQDELPSSERRRLLDSLYELALVDGPLQRSEREVLRRAARGLGVREADEQAITERHLGSGEEHFATLGLTPDATDAEVKSAFRRLAAEYHPDKAAHQGGRAAEQAARRFQQVRDAYEEIRRLRGL